MHSALKGPFRQPRAESAQPTEPWVTGSATPKPALKGPFYLPSERVAHPALKGPFRQPRAESAKPTEPWVARIHSIGRP